MKKEIYTCDGCGKYKQQTNHWFKVFMNEGHLEIWPFLTKGVGGELGGEYFCGEECLLKMVARNLPK